MKTHTYLFTILLGTAACGGPPDAGFGTTSRASGTPGCPDCPDACELEDTATELKVFGHPLDVDPPITSVTARLISSSQTCSRSVNPQEVTIVPSETDWFTKAEPACGLASPTSAELVIVAQDGQTVLPCRIE